MQDQNLKALFWYGDFDKYFLGHQAAEILKDRIYKPYLETLKDPVVIDCGANLGLFTLYASKYAKHVYAIEPFSKHFQLLKMMVMHNGLTNVTPINKAIWIENKKLPLGGPDTNETMTSLHQATWQDGKLREEVECMSFDTLFKEHNIEHVDLCKTDVEGSEIEILSSSGFKEVAPKIDTMVIELHQWNNRHPNQIREALKNAGFTSIQQIPNDATIVVAQKKERSIL